MPISPCRVQNHALECRNTTSAHEYPESAYRATLQVYPCQSTPPQSAAILAKY